MTKEYINMIYDPNIICLISSDQIKIRTKT